MNPETKTNIKNLPTNYTTWVIAAISALLAWWLQLAPSTQAEYLALYPWLKYVAPLASAAAFVIARVLPQVRVDPQAQDVGQVDDQEKL